MRKIIAILWIFWLLVYLLFLQEDMHLLVHKYYLCGVIVMVCLLILLMGLSQWNRIKNNTFLNVIIHKHIPKAIYDYGRINGFINAIISMIAIYMTIPVLVFMILEKLGLFVFSAELKIYLILTISSLLITFSGKWLTRLLNKYFISNPSKLSKAQSELVASEDIIKVFFFGIYFILLIVSAVLKFQHTPIGVFNDSTISSILLAFTTYIALDRVISAFRKAKEKFQSENNTGDGQV